MATTPMRYIFIVLGVIVNPHSQLHLVRLGTKLSH